MRCIILREDDTWEYVEVDKDTMYEEFAMILDGDCEWVETGYNTLCMFCDDMGRSKRLGYNILANKFRASYYAWQNPVVGDVILIGLDEEGHCCSLTKEQEERINKILNYEDIISKEEKKEILNDMNLFLKKWMLDGSTMVEDYGKRIELLEVNEELGFGSLFTTYRNDKYLTEKQKRFLSEVVLDSSVDEIIRKQLETDYDVWSDSLDLHRFYPSFHDPCEFDSYEEYLEYEESIFPEIEDESWVSGKEVESLKKISDEFEALTAKHKLEWYLLSSNSIAVELQYF